MGEQTQSLAVHLKTVRLNVLPEWRPECNRLYTLLFHFRFGKRVQDQVRTHEKHFVHLSPINERAKRVSGLYLFTVAMTQ